MNNRAAFLWIIIFIVMNRDDEPLNNVFNVVRVAEQENAREEGDA